MQIEQPKLLQICRMLRPIKAIKIIVLACTIDLLEIFKVFDL
jgi:hypothetical protein